MKRQEINAIWELVKELFVNEYGIEHKHILNQTEIWSISTDFCYLHTQGSYNYDQLLNIQDKLSAVVNKVLLVRGQKVELVIKNEIPKEMLNIEVETEKTEEEDSPEDSNELKKEYQLENFIVGNNQYPYNICYSVLDTISNNEKPKYNPIILFGGTGYGKTHLVQAIGNAVLDRDPQKKVRYLTASTFNNEFLEAIRGGRLKDNRQTAQSFRKKYTDVDLIIIDDIQFFERVFGRGEGSVEEEFFNTFDTLIRTDKQIMFTSDRNPKDIKNLTDRIKSRFSAGIFSEINKPDYSTRAAIVNTVCENSNVTLDNDMIEYIAVHVTENVKKIRGVLDGVFAKHYLLDQPITINLIKEEIELRGIEEKAVFSAENIIEKITNKYNITTEELKSQNRKATILIPRQIAMYILKEKVEMTVSAIGRMFGRDHSTVMNAIEKIKKDMEKDISFDKEVNNIIREIMEQS